MNDRSHCEKRNFFQHNSRAASLILEIGKTIDDVHFGFSKPGLVARFGIDGARDHINKKEFYLRKQEMRRLEVKKIIVREKITNGYLISFSKVGFEEYITHLSISATNLPSNQICVISFDIPETQKRFRGQVRSLLRKLGFQQMHRSVWFSKKNVGDYVAKLFSSRFDSNNWFRILIASEL